jgi:hypothetical protein
MGEKQPDSFGTRCSLKAGVPSGIIRAPVLQAKL